MDAEREKAFLDVVSRIPPTWTCIRCGTVFDNTPNGEPPYAFEVTTDENGFRKQAGDICEKCYRKPV